MNKKRYEQPQADAVKVTTKDSVLLMASAETGNISWDAPKLLFDTIEDEEESVLP